MSSIPAILRLLTSQKTTNRSQESEEQKTSRCVTVASHAISRRSEESDDVVKKRRSSTRIRNAVSRAKQTVRQRFIRNAAKRVRKSTRQGALLGIAASGAQLDEKKKLRADAKNFRENIRQYNNSTAVACMKAEVKLPSGGPYTYCVHKQMVGKNFNHILLISNPGGFKPASTEENFSPDKYRLLQRHARLV
ncbi:hypothetical protein CRE_27781 [Caenorhabditis remanei]|uniref:Uncharacterized protein n=1 Tax=Caenorhabditis remanei TaxID=31234 RepID=E3MXR2_CAERE|nr:hypothetical protein CRE_27781 [Caenorhabditis remanei]